MYGCRMRSVLVVEDDADSRESIQTFLSATLGNVRLVTAANVQEAQSALDRESFDVVVSDDDLAGGRGVDLLAWSQRKQPTARRFLFTGLGDDGARPSF